MALTAVIFAIGLSYRCIALETGNENHYAEERIRELEEILERADEDVLDSVLRSNSLFEAALIDAGELAFPVLRKALSDRSNEAKHYLAAYGIALIGGASSRDILKEEYQETKDIRIKSFLSFCMGSTGDPEDIRFLKRSLKDETLDDEGEIVGDPESAALSLGVLRVSDAIDDLKFLAGRDQSSIDSHAAQEVLKWIGREVPATPQSANASEREQLILSMFRSGIPRTDESDIFFEEKQNLKWIWKDNSWNFYKTVMNAASKDAPRISFDVIQNRDKTTAIIKVGLIFGPLNGKGYTYVLKKNAGQWKVVGILSTWIS